MKGTATTERPRLMRVTTDDRGRLTGGGARLLATQIRRGWAGWYASAGSIAQGLGFVTVTRPDGTSVRVRTWEEAQRLEEVVS